VNISNFTSLTNIVLGGLRGDSQMSLRYFRSRRSILLFTFLLSKTAASISAPIEFKRPPIELETDVFN
jgi:hypothetical protein